MTNTVLQMWNLLLESEVKKNNGKAYRIAKLNLGLIIPGIWEESRVLAFLMETLTPLAASTLSIFDRLRLSLIIALIHHM